MSIYPYYCIQFVSRVLDSVVNKTKEAVLSIQFSGGEKRIGKFK